MDNSPTTDSDVATATDNPADQSAPTIDLANLWPRPESEKEPRTEVGRLVMDLAVQEKIPGYSFLGQPLTDMSIERARGVIVHVHSQYETLLAHARQLVDRVQADTAMRKVQRLVYLNRGALIGFGLSSAVWIFVLFMLLIFWRKTGAM